MNLRYIFQPKRTLNKPYPNWDYPTKPLYTVNYALEVLKGTVLCSTTSSTLVHNNKSAAYSPPLEFGVIPCILNQLTESDTEYTANFKNHSKHIKTINKAQTSFNLDG